MPQFIGAKLDLSRELAVCVPYAGEQPVPAPVSDLDIMREFILKFRMSLWAALLGSALFNATSLHAAHVWDLAGDWTGNPATSHPSLPINPNGPWSYGGSQVWLNDFGAPAYSIQPGQVSLSSDAPGNSYATWTSPINGTVEVTGSFGSTPISDGYGFGNNFSDRWVKDNGAIVWHIYGGQTVDYFDLTLSVSVGDQLTFMVGSQGPNSGNTQTEAHIVAVPEPATVATGLCALGLLLVSLRARRSSVNRE